MPRDDQDLAKLPDSPSLQALLCVSSSPPGSPGWMHVSKIHRQLLKGPVSLPVNYQAEQNSTLQRSTRNQKSRH